MTERLEEKITKILLPSIAGAACVLGGIVSGLSKAQGILTEYQTMARYGPVLASAAIFASYAGIEGYAQAREEPRLQNPFSFALKVAGGAALFAASLGEYNTGILKLVSQSISWLYQQTL